MLQARCPSQVVRKGWYTRCTKDSDTGPRGAPMTHTLRLWGARTGPGRQQGLPGLGPSSSAAQGSRGPRQGVLQQHLSRARRETPARRTLGAAPGLLAAHPVAPSPGSPRPVDVLRAACCQDQEPERKQLLGAPHGPSFQVEWPSPRGGLEHRAQPCEVLLQGRPRAGTTGETVPSARTPARLTRLLGPLAAAGEPPRPVPAPLPPPS